MRINFLVFVLFLFVLFLSCKKKKSNEEPPEETTPANTSIPFDGYLYSSRDTSFGTITTVKVSGIATFYQTSVPNTTTSGTPVYAGKLYLNTDTLTYSPGYYSGNTTTNVPTTDIWSTNGSTFVPAFSYTNNDQLPNCDFKNVPASISITSGSTFTLNVLNSKGGGFYIGATTATNNITYTLVPGQNIVTITPQKLAPMVPGNTLFRLTLYNNDKYADVGVKKYLFNKSCAWEKIIAFTP